MNPSDQSRGLVLTPEEFGMVCRLAYDTCGLDLKPGKEELVASRLGKQIRRLGFGSFREYFRCLKEQPNGPVMAAAIDALTTHHTSFLREAAHFDFLNTTVFPEAARNGRIAVWCAASSTGEEPYTLLMSADAALGPAARQIQLLASDVSEPALESARRGVYSADRLDSLPKEWLPRYFLRGNGRFSGSYRIKPKLAQQVEFRRVNLIEPFPSMGPFAVVLCRNVMIYFDRPTQERLIEKIFRVLAPGGYLLVGHAESLTGVKHGLAYVRPSIYRKAGPTCR
ncbi:MAG: protein-glutamate O-methyltransferase CheR [Bryobacteraceae bacterium]|nr:protein-glutamate O-methyltransferase CheR [Bryobacteraceae bacterium]